MIFLFKMILILNWKRWIKKFFKKLVKLSKRLKVFLNEFIKKRKKRSSLKLKKRLNLESLQNLLHQCNNFLKKFKKNFYLHKKCKNLVLLEIMKPILRREDEKTLLKRLKITMELEILYLNKKFFMMKKIKKFMNFFKDLIIMISIQRMLFSN